MARAKNSLSTSGGEFDVANFSVMLLRMCAAAPRKSTSAMLVQSIEEQNAVK
jgi:hypothetical protein